MSVEILDDFCLLKIFREINDKQTLINCSQVNRRWHSLILPSINYRKTFSRQNRKDKEKNIKKDGEIVAITDKIEADFFPKHGRKIKQLFITNMTLDDFKKIAKYLPRLERLHLTKYSSFSEPSESYDGPKLERLEILEISTRSEDYVPYRGLSLMDRCPNLKSAFHYIDDENFFVDTQVTNYYLEDLVIENMSYTEAVDWSTLKKILGKCPNLKHLAIRHERDTDIEDENIPEMLELLPKVVLIDLRLSPGITHVSADYVEEYCKLHNRTISFYYTKEHERDIKAHWPKLSDKTNDLCFGYSFMKHCFLKPFDRLPSYMDPTFLIPLLKESKRKNKAKLDIRKEDFDLRDILI